MMAKGTRQRGVIDQIDHALASEYVDDRGHRNPGARLLVDEVEASLARLIFEKYPSLTNGGLAEWLNANGYRLPCKSPARRERHGRSDRLFDSKAITDIISNDLYTGTLSWGKTTKVEGQNPEEFRHHVPELQIVSFEAFARAQEARADRRRVPSKSQGSRYTYSDLLRCPSAVVRLSGRGSGTSPTAIVRRGGMAVFESMTIRASGHGRPLQPGFAPARYRRSRGNTLPATVETRLWVLTSQ